ncbi:hypothetical protein MY04_0076 [Flammeovirga sp. MY04]|uniref:hypothetical protein n=1 Tax=Flammeovirga sp. MY04 TaxID=1191459 RepID=UPI00080611C5|nr:hypothetical protein [Flammeovirga sp. MY04]ANQ47459.1 hypothetical protein MY04_0076 [Flammeovirga sp. MY04]
MDNLNVYQPSGKFSPISLIFFFLVSFTVLPILGLIYAYSIWYIPIIYLNFLLAILFGAATGYVINFVVVGKGKIRNIYIAKFFGVLGALVAMYFHWIIWADLVINAGEYYGSDSLGVTLSNIDINQVYSLLINPLVLFDLISEINVTGTWSLGTVPANGLFLIIIWLIEAGLIIVPSFMLSSRKASMPFCEMGNDWFKETKLPEYEYFEDPYIILEKILNKQTDFISELVFVDNKKQHHSVIKLYTSDYDENYLTLENKTAYLDRDNNIKLDTIIIVQHLKVEKSIVNKLINHRPKVGELGELRS